MRTLLCVALLAASALCAQAQTVVNLQGSVSGGWPAALSNVNAEVLLRVTRLSPYSAQDRTFSFNPSNWPSPNNLTYAVTGTVGDTIDAFAGSGDNGTTTVTGSNGKSYRYWLDGDGSKTHTIVAADPNPLPLTVNITLVCKLIGDVDEDGDVDACGSRGSFLSVPSGCR